MLAPTALKTCLLLFRSSLMKAMSKLDVGVSIVHIEALGTKLEVYFPRGARTELCLKI